MSNIPQINIKFGKQGMESVVGNQANVPTPFAPSEYRPDMSTFNTAIAQKMQGDIELTKVESQAFQQIPNAVFKARELDLKAQEQCAANKAKADELALKKAEADGKQGAAIYFKAKEELLKPDLSDEERKSLTDLADKYSIPGLMYGTKEQNDVYSKKEIDGYNAQAEPSISIFRSLIDSTILTTTAANRDNSVHSLIANAMNGKIATPDPEGNLVLVDDERFTPLLKLPAPVRAIIAEKSLGYYKTRQDSQKLLADTTLVVKQAGTEAQKAIEASSKNLGTHPDQRVAQENAETNRINANTNVFVAEQNAKDDYIKNQIAVRGQDIQLAISQGNANKLSHEDKKLYADSNKLAIAKQVNKSQPIPSPYIPGVTKTHVIGTMDAGKGSKQADPKLAKKIDSVAAVVNDVYASQLLISKNPIEAWNNTVKIVTGKAYDNTWNFKSQYNQSPELKPEDTITYLNRFRQVVVIGQSNYLQAYVQKYNETVVNPDSFTPDQ